MWLMEFCESTRSKVRPRRVGLDRARIVTHPIGQPGERAEVLEAGPEVTRAARGGRFEADDLAGAEGRRVERERARAAAHVELRAVAHVQPTKDLADREEAVPSAASLREALGARQGIEEVGAHRLRPRADQP
jgi:hypothetical protein